MRDPLSQTFSALADPTRRAMLARLSRGEANVSDLARPFLASVITPKPAKDDRLKTGQRDAAGTGFI